MRISLPSARLATLDTTGGEIDRKSRLLYKHNLLVLNRRYGDLEQRILKTFARQPANNELWLISDLEMLLLYLLEDGLLIDTGQTRPIGNVGGPTQKLFKLTEKGRDHIALWMPPEKMS